MTLSGARSAYLHAERLAIQFPRKASCQRMRQHAYAGWLQACRSMSLSQLRSCAEAMHSSDTCQNNTLDGA